MQNTNSLRDEVRLQQQKLKDQPLSKKWEYFWHYYKIHVCITFLAACMFGSILHSVINQKETLLSIALINAFPTVEDEVLMEDIETYMEINQKKQQIVLDSTYYIDEQSTSPYAETYSQKFFTNAMAGKLDVVLADVSNFDLYGNQGFFQDLSLVLSQETLAFYADKLYYLDHPDDNQDIPVPI